MIVKETIGFTRQQGIHKSMDIGVRKLADKLTSDELEEWYNMKAFDTFEEYWEWLNGFPPDPNFTTPEEAHKIAMDIEETFGKFIKLGKSFDWKEAKKEVAYIEDFQKKNPQYKFAYDATPSHDSNSVVFSEIEFPNADKLKYYPEFL